jgi:hypothetical protein
MDCGVAGGWPHDSSLCEAKREREHQCRLLPRLTPEDLEEAEILVEDLRRDSDMKWPTAIDPITRAVLTQGEWISEEFEDEPT